MIEANFLDKTTSTTFSLKLEVQNIKKGTMSITEYMQKIKAISDSIDAIKEDKSDHNLL